MKITESGIDRLHLAVQLVVAMIGLTSIVGLVPTLCGLGSIVVVAPLATLFGTMAQRVSKTLITKTDARIEIMTEVLSSALHTQCCPGGPRCAEPSKLFLLLSVTFSP